MKSNINYKKAISIGAFLIIFPVMITALRSWKQTENEPGYELMKKYVIINRKGYEEKMDVEKFIPCVLAARMDMESPKEALKAQAVVIRTYILYKMNDREEIPATELALPYITYEEMKIKWENKSRIENTGSLKEIIYNTFGLRQNKYFVEKYNYLCQIIDKTNLQVMKSDGELILPLFHEISAGTTRDGKEVFGGKYAYVLSVKCDDDIEVKGYLEVNYFTVEEVIEKMKKGKIIVYKDNQEMFIDSDNGQVSVDEFLKLFTYKIDENGYVISVRICDTYISGEDFARAIGANSTNMQIEKYEEGIRVTTKGKGHGFGLSMSQAKALAEDGADYEKILKTFYDVTISEE